MIKKEIIEQLTADVLTGEFFLIQVTVKQGNVIEVIIDGDNGVSIQKCVDVSRYIEQHLDRESEDFELSVYSAGLGNPFKVYRQYEKNIGKEVDVKQGEEKPLSGTILSVDENGFDLETKVSIKDEATRKKKEVKKVVRFNFTDQPEVKNSITFK
ncbi:MAG TPA: ribosome assembly cofactor RimP [Prolixibacteraceae bacterium]|nr:ribosome assembly cofactor RimP [Bacteroidales bacterium]HQN94133.1 ribosome assembly cofactor RimP [Prolixibacteraceae bacterium]HUM88442.1 ribosome assembly cofactor RimP [Prolixibacteraceae bacterium]